MELVSIIIPVYNVERYLNKCIESVIHQTYGNKEIILVDDGSSDKSGEICDRYAEQIEYIYTIHQENKGVSEARKKGLKKASGEYIVFIDADDWVDSAFVEILFETMKSTNADMVSCGYYEEYKNSTIKINNSGELIEYPSVEAIKVINQRKDIYSFLWNKLLKKEFLQNLDDSVPVIIGEDYTIVVKAVARMKKIVSIQKSLYHYIQRSTGACNRGFDERMFDVVFNYKKIYEYFENKDIEYLRYIKNYILYEEMYYVICMNKNKKYDKKFIQMVTNDVRQSLWRCLKQKDLSVIFKGCAVAMSVNYRFLIAGYKILNHNRQNFA